MAATQDELILLNRARALEQDALTEIHERYYVPIYRYIAYRVNEPQVVEDLTSEVFLRLLSALRDSHAPQNTLRGWLYGVASNIVKEYYRQKKRAKLTLLDESMPSNGRSLTQQIDHKLMGEKLLALMKDLTEDQQQVLALRFGFEMSIKEVAELMGKSEGSVKMLQARAIASLASRIPAEAMAA
ncbi:MAG: sigma-70 family RNA polymerase sigma factor [Anaerolineales bacterium]|nr:sigma-70 family RNA polymerase sigma factor [Anaerolineales bacterium]MCB8983689.1 sigma-70 family RNA polymerase sigma factor [Ardenticatenaceae bacterium]